MSKPSTVPAAAPVPHAIPPCCPHCGDPLNTVNLYNWQAGAFVILSVSCPKRGCEKLLHMMTIAVSELPGGGEPRVHLPS